MLQVLSELGKLRALIYPVVIKPAVGLLKAEAHEQEEQRVKTVGRKK